MDTLVNIITSFFTGISDFFGAILDFLYLLKNVPQLVKELLDALLGSNEHFFAWLFAKLIELAVLAYFTLMTWLIPFVWDIASVIVRDIYNAAGIQQFASAIPAPINSVLSMMGVYRAFDIIITAYITRWIFRFIPFVGA